ncbi:MAG: hypothetical protein ACK520_05180, partial [Inhella sp.]
RYGQRYGPLAGSPPKNHSGMRPPRPWRPHWGESEQKEFFRSDYLTHRYLGQQSPDFMDRFNAALTACMGPTTAASNR